MTTNPAKKIAGIQLKELAIDDIRIDTDTYQRPQIDAQVHKIVDTWDMDLFSAPTIIHRMDGTYWAVDGQQRLAAARILEYTHVWAKVIHARDIRHEAWLFTNLNLIPRHLGAQDVYKSNLVWGEQISLACEKILGEFGLTGIHTGTPREVRAIAKMREAWGPAGSEKCAVLPAARLKEGEQVLRWAIAAGTSMLDKGERAGQVYNGTNLGALVWMRRNAVSTPNLLEVQKLLGRTTALYVKETITGITGSSGGSQRARWGTRLAGWINAQYDKTVVDLPTEAWETVDDTDHSIGRKNQSAA